MKLKNALTASVAGAALFALAAPVATSDAKADISNGNKNSLTVSGQVVRSILWADDGNNEDVFMTDGSTTASRVRWVAKGQMNEATSVGAIIEMNVPFSNSIFNANLDPADTRIADSGWGIRHAAISVAHKQFGSVKFGQTSPFTDGVSTGGINMGVLWGGVNNTPTAASFEFYNSNTNAYSGIEASSVFTSTDPGRVDTLTYSTPSFAGFTVGGSWIDGSGGDIGVKYAGKFGGFAVDAGLGYHANAGTGDVGDTDDGWIGTSIGVEHDSGIGAAVMYGEQQAISGTNDTQAYGAGLSYAASLYSAGATKFAATYYQIEDVVSNGDEGGRWQAGVLQNFDSVGMDAGIMYEHMSYEDTTAGSDYDDISTVLFSARLKF